MSTLKMFTIRVQNHATKEWLGFLGQGTSVEEALSDGMKTLRLSFRPRDGAVRPPETLNVRLADGTPVARTLTEFEGDTPNKPKEGNA